MAGMMKLPKTLALPLVALAFSGGASAQFVGPSSVKLTTVAEVLKNGTDDQHVALRGNLLKKVGSEKYDFSDGTGTIRVEIDKKIFPREPIDEKTKLELQGEVEKEFMASPEIDVDSIRRVD
jgi:uncharacterized protein (TIGR00156 family)